MEDPKGMASLDKGNNSLGQLCRLSLAVMTLLHDPIEELPTLAQLHNKVNRRRVLVRASDPHHVRMLRQMVHYLNLSPHVLVVLRAQKLPLRDRLARIPITRRLLRAQKRRPELPLSQLSPQTVHFPNVLGPIREDPYRLRWRRARR